EWSLQKEPKNERSNATCYQKSEDTTEIKQTDAEDLFKSIAYNTTVKINFPEDIEDYLKNLLTRDIASILTKAKEPLSNDAQLLLL
ncbi:23638_t:CDS:2, partial [Dentiscutata erythropus]